jgi:RNA polymerase sigma-70 factor (ECF subfamily)
VAAARDGDGQAFAQLYESMNRRVSAFLSYRGATDPEGMVNDVFLKVFTKLDTFDGNQIQFTAWVFKIARNTLIDESRARSRRVEETSLQDSHEVTHWSGDVETDAIDQMTIASVLQHLEVLTPEQRDVIVMRVASDLTIEAIAQIVGKRIGAVKAMQRRALRSLARSFDGEAVPR